MKKTQINLTSKIIKSNENNNNRKMKNLKKYKFKIQIKVKHLIYYFIL